jgi:energy-coupling factor transport system ATP-binding protein
MGPNGSGKTSLLWAIQQKHSSTLLPQTASDLLMFSSVKEELADSDNESRSEPGTTAKMLENLSQRLDPNRHPRDLSAGQQLSLVLAIQLSREADVLLLDEPTRGLDYEAKRHLAAQLQVLKTTKAILLASHDVEFLALVANEIIEITNGILKAPQPPQIALGALGALAPQIWQVTESVLTVEQAVAAVVR